MDHKVPPFDQRQRYEIVAELAASLPAGIRVLDVGGFYRELDGTVSLPIRDAVPHARTVTVDLERDLPPEGGSHEDSSSVESHETPSSVASAFRRKELGLYAVADGTRLPFANAAFDVVSCLDVLEHVPRGRRGVLIMELFRVSRGYVVLAMPIADDGAAERERALQRYISVHLETEQQQLREHAQFGLPTHAEVKALLPPAAVSFGYGNLDRWAVMMFAKHFLLGVPHNLDAFYALDAEYAKLSRDGDLVGPFYRRAFVSAAPGAKADIVGNLARKYRLEAPPEGSVIDEVLDLVFDVLVRADPDRLRTEREVAEERATHFERALAEARAHAGNLEDRARHLEGALEQSGAHIANLEQAAEKSAAHIANLEQATQKSAAHIANLEEVQRNLKDALEGAQIHIRNLEAGHRAQVAVLEQSIAELREVLRQVEASKVYRLYRFTQRLSGAGKHTS